MDWTAGLFFYQSAAENYQTVSFPADPVGHLQKCRRTAGLRRGARSSTARAAYSVNTRNIADSTSEAAYANVVIDLTQKMHLTLGLRYSQGQEGCRLRQHLRGRADPH